MLTITTLAVFYYVYCCILTFVCIREMLCLQFGVTIGHSVQDSVFKLCCIDSGSLVRHFV